ncbi:cytochrome c [Hydrogenophaga sp.]|uniref:c-type cytochrome n=1 Tax=Hydrogenophaga sp. TaxID=1904254 RepID=UPI002731EF30|nr:cytochrome c [Hydrogenophaga sp.]MDP2074662.1 cytochrome c [Hydrogenophaga sp.]MDP3106369.1 cytochrome c [Hydrogenophaga sp.]MDZ4398908.1 cytochrome c [Hydrogenophaga sp.]
MKNALIPLCFAAGLSLLAGAALAQGRPATADPGKREFDANCASCHGTSGKGDGPLVPFLTRSPPDLTQLAKRNGGVLPMSRLYDVIDGAEVPAHGSRDMPVWGRDYRVKDAEYFMEAPYNAEAHVRARILGLLEYINRIQAK